MSFGQAQVPVKHNWVTNHSSREGNGTPLQYSCLESPMDGGAWWAAVHGVTKSRTWLSHFTFTFSLSCIGEGNGNPLQCSCLENPRDRGAWWAAVYGVTQSRTRLKWLSSSSKHRRVPARWVWVPILGKQFQTQFSEIERWWLAQYFVKSGMDGERSWKTGGKSSGKKVPRNPFYNLLEKLLNAWPVPTMFIGWILSTKKIKGRKTLRCLGNSY